GRELGAGLAKHLLIPVNSGVDSDSAAGGLEGPGTLIRMPCIYPGPHSDQMSVKHPVPYALGRFSGFALLRDRVCRACNTEIGKRIETQFLPAGPTGFFRWLLGVRGRGGLPPSPFLTGAAGVPAMEMPGRLPDAPYEVLFEVNPAGVRRPSRAVRSSSSTPPGDVAVA